MAYPKRTQMFVLRLEIQVGSCLYVTAAVNAASHFGRAQGDHSGQSISWVRWGPSPPHVHTQYVHVQRGLPRFFNEVWVYPFFFFIWFPFHPFPLHTLLFSSFLSCPLVFMSFISSFLSFARTLVPALACTCTTTCT